MLNRKTLCNGRLWKHILENMRCTDKDVVETYLNPGQICILYLMRNIKTALLNQTEIYFQLENT